jgi:pre-mRNA-processing factor SLU7
MDRPRKVNAKKANKTFGDDEEIQDLNLTFEAKIDRWNGFDPEMYNKEVITEWNKLEIERKKLKAEQLEQKLKDKVNKPKTELDEIMSGSDLEDESDQEVLDKEVDDDDPNLAKNPRVKSINKNLRDRTETVKYLQNIWDNNVHYDGKSRALTDIPQENNEQSKAFNGNII